MMKAIVIDRHGDPELFHEAQVPVPVPGPDDVLIRVHASSLNPADLRARREEPGRAIPRRFPLILGYDFSGVVDVVGARVTAFRRGDHVFGSPSLFGQAGAHAEYVVVDARTIAIKPNVLTHAEAAVAPLVCLTAWNALHERARVQAGQWLLVHGGAGGVGHVALQLAKRHGCRVIATAGRPESVALCRALGADHVIDYRREDFEARTLAITGGHGVQAALDVVGGDTLERTVRCTAALGTIVSIVPSAIVQTVQAAFMRSLSVHYEMMGSRAAYGVEPERLGAALARIAALLESRSLQVRIHQTYAVRDLAKAHRALEQGAFEGKLAIAVHDGFSI